MKKYMFLVAMAILAIQFLSCSKNDEESVLQRQNPVTSRSLPDDTEIPTGAIGGSDTKPVEGPMFYNENPYDVISVVCLAECYTIDENDSVFLSKNLGGGVLTQDGGSFVVTLEGKGLHIVGTGVSKSTIDDVILSTTSSLDIDDVKLIESGDATITNFDFSETMEIILSKGSVIDKEHISASDIPKASGLYYTIWEGGTVTDYSWTSTYSSLSLVDNPANYIEVWVNFKEGTVVKARIGGS